MIHYPLPPHLQEAYAELGYKKGDFPMAEKIAAQTLSIPLYQGMGSESQLQIIQVIKNFFKR